MYKILMTDAHRFHRGPEQEMLQQVGAEWRAYACRTEDEVIEHGHDADALLVGMAPISRRVIEHLTRCRVIVRYGIGVDVVDVAAATEHGICVANVPDFCFDEVSDTAMSLILCTTRKVALLNNAVRRGVWNRRIAAPIYKLRGSTLGIVGFGNIGRALVPKARAFGFQIIACDPYVSGEIACSLRVPLVSLDPLLERADVISIHTPLTEETFHLIGERELKKMKSSAYLVNTGRGAVVDTDALYRALQEGWIAGAGLDVIEGEPLKGDEPILALDNIVFTPHYASYTEEAYHELAVKVAEGAIQALRGEFPKYLVNPEVKDRPNARVRGTSR